MLAKNPVRIDGEELTPILERTNYVKVGLQGIQLLEKPERLEVSTAIVGVIITYITPGMPQGPGQGRRDPRRLHALRDKGPHGRHKKGSRRETLLALG